MYSGSDSCLFSHLGPSLVSMTLQRHQPAHSAPVNATWGPMDLHALRFLKRPWLDFLPPLLDPLLLELCLYAWEPGKPFWWTAPQRRHWVSHKHLQQLSLNHLPHSKWAHIFLVQHFSTYGGVETLLTALDIVASLSLRWAVAFLMPSLHAWAMFPHPSFVVCPCF